MHSSDQMENTTDNIIINSHAQGTTARQPTEFFKSNTSVIVHKYLTVRLPPALQLPRSKLFSWVDIVFVINNKNK
jgi:hypothetical protein